MTSTDSGELLQRLRELHPRRIDLSLDRMLRLLATLGDPQRRLPPVVHAAGTNGKGSVLALLRAMLEAAGRRVHSYHSPPLTRFHECVRLATSAGTSDAIDEARLTDVLARVLAANSGAPLTSFEGETAAAFLAFAEVPGDVVMLETGMGGRLDATNVVEQPLLTILTPIGLDHTELLGSTLTAIAGEKAGILRPGVPCVVARQPEEALTAIRSVAAVLGAPLLEHGQHWDAFEQHGRLVYQDESGLLDLPRPALAGRHQIDNAGVAVAAALQLGALAPDEAAVARGLASVTWPGRLQPLRRGGLVERLPPGSEIWVDGGHNPAAAAVLAQAMAEAEEAAPKPLHLLVGMLASKRPEAFLRPFRGLASSVTGIAVPDVSRAYAGSRTGEDIAAEASVLGLPGRPAADLREGLAAIAESAGGAAVRVLVCGSLHLAGSVLSSDARNRRSS